MEYAIILALLVVKHWLLATVIDSGYSDSRDPLVRQWRLFLAIHAIVEALVTVICFQWRDVFPLSLGLFLLVEAIGGIAACLIERNAPLNRLIGYHAISEGLYWTLLAVSAYVFLR